jgi:hypothetical protein
VRDFDPHAEADDEFLAMLEECSTDELIEMLDQCPRDEVAAIIWNDEMERPLFYVKLYENALRSSTVPEYLKKVAQHRLSECLAKIKH